MKERASICLSSTRCSLFRGQICEETPFLVARGIGALYVATGYESKTPIDWHPTHVGQHVAENIAEGMPTVLNAKSEIVWTVW